MTKYVISGYIGLDNFGDEAICGLLTGYLKNQDNGKNKITVLSHNPEKTSRLYGVDSVHLLKFFVPIIKSDVLISGGGSLLQDVTSLKSLIYYLIVITTALIFGKKVIIFAQGFTPFKSKIGKVLTKFVLKFCHKITVRDIKSQEMLEKMGIKSELIPDPVFGIQVPNVGKQEGLGVQLRGFATLTDEFLNSLADEIAKHFKNETVKLFSLQDLSDLPIIDKFAGMLISRGVMVKIYKELSVAEVINEISSLKYLIGMRFHANLVAAKAGVKILGINYDIKVKTLSETVGFPIINIYGCEVEEGIHALFDVDTENYSLPSFDFNGF